MRENHPFPLQKSGCKRLPARPSDDLSVRRAHMQTRALQPHDGVHVLAAPEGRTATMDEKKEIAAAKSLVHIVPA